MKTRNQTTMHDEKNCSNCQYGEYPVCPYSLKKPDPDGYCGMHSAKYQDKKPIRNLHEYSEGMSR